MNTVHIKKGDTVQVISGKSKGKKGKVIEVAPDEGKAIVEGVNIVSKHVKPRGQQQGGIIKTPGPLYVCKLMVVCDKCGKPTRVGKRTLADGTKVRYCKHCNENF